MDPYILIDKYYSENKKARKILVTHSELVAKKAVKIAKKIGLTKAQQKFIYEACMLHDIGIYLTDAPEIHCRGSYPYICHGYLGHDILVKEGYPEHALICERHTGTGISKKEIKQRNLPIPYRSMKPKTIEQKIITYADKFFSKDPKKIKQEKTVDKVREKLAKHGPDKIEKFNKWHEEFGLF
jgi:uncharacterized protein